MPNPKDEILQRIAVDRENFFNQMKDQYSAASSLPPEAKVETYQKLKKLSQTGANVFRQQSIQAHQGIVPETYKQESPREGALNFILRSLGKPNSALNYTAQALTANTLQDRELAAANALKSAVPFYESLSGETVPLTGADETMRKAGVATGGTLSDVLPQLYSETGSEWTKLKRDGILDPTARGAAGFAADIVADPLNFIPVGKGIGLAARGLDNFVTKATGKGVRELAYANPAITTIARGFNKFAFLTRDPEQALKAETAFRNLLDDLPRLTAEDADDVAKVFQDPKMLGDAAVFKSLSSLDDYQRLADKGDFQELSKQFPQFNKSLMIDKEGKINLGAYLDIEAANKGLTPAQIAAAKNIRQFIDKEGKEAVASGFLKPDEVLYNYLPRKLVNMKVLDDLGSAEIAALTPDQRSIIDGIITGREAEAAAGLSMKSVNLNRMNVGNSYKKRIFNSFAESADHAKAFGGKINQNLGELLFRLKNGRRVAEANEKLLNDLGTIFGSDTKYWPKNVKDTLEQVGKQSGPDALKGFKKIWNHNFLNPLKASLTFPFPVYHMRNIVDDTLRGYEQFGLKWVDPQATGDAMHVMSQAAKTVDLGNGITADAGELFQRMSNVGIYKHQFHRADVQRTVQQVVKKYAEANSPTKSTLRKAFEWLPMSETFAQKFNNHARIKGALVALKDTIKNQGIKSIDSQEFQAALLNAAKESKHAFIDLADLGPVDDMLAQVIPFYRFSRKNLPFHAKQIINHPERLSKLTMAQHNLQTDQLSEDEQLLLAPYIRDNINLSMGDDVNGNHIMLTSSGLSLEDFNKLYSSEGWAATLTKLVVGQAAPPLQAIYGLISNKHPFFGYELDSYRARNTYKLMHDNKMLNWLVGGVSREITGKDSEGNPEFKYLLDDPKQYFKVMSIYTPALAAAAGNIPGGGAVGSALVNMLGGAVSPRMLSMLGTKSLPGEEYTESFLKAVNPYKTTAVNFKREKIRQMQETMSKAYEDLRQETKRIKAFNKMGQEITRDDFDLLDGMEE